MSTKELTTDSDVQNLDYIGDARAEELGVETVGELAEQSAQEMHNKTKLPKNPLLTAMKQAREIAGIDEEPRIYTEDESEDGIVSVETMDADEFANAGASEQNHPSECTKVAVIGGDDAFDHDGPYGDANREELAQLVQKRLVESGLADNLEELYAVGSGMGRKAVNEWVSFTIEETDRELPELKQVTVDRDSDLSWKERFQKRNERILDEVDAVCVVANGDYVGIWVTMVNERDDGTYIWTPPQDEDEGSDAEWDDVEG